MCRNAHPKTTQPLPTAETNRSQPQASPSQPQSSMQAPHQCWQLLSCHVMPDVAVVARDFQTGRRKTSKNSGTPRFNNAVGDDLVRRPYRCFPTVPGCFGSVRHEQHNGRARRRGAERPRKVFEKEAQKGADGPRQAQRSERPEGWQMAQAGQRERPSTEGPRKAHTGPKRLRHARREPRQAQKFPDKAQRGRGPKNIQQAHSSPERAQRAPQLRRPREAQTSSALGPVQKEEGRGVQGIIISIVSELGDHAWRPFRGAEPAVIWLSARRRPPFRCDVGWQAGFS